MDEQKISIEELNIVSDVFFDVASGIRQSEASVKALREMREVKNAAFVKGDSDGLYQLFKDISEMVRLFDLSAQITFLIKVKEVTSDVGLFGKVESRLHKTATKLLQKKGKLDEEEIAFLSAWKEM